MWNKELYLSRQIKQVKGLDKNSHTHEMRRHYESSDKTAYRLFEYIKEPDDEYSSMFKTRIKPVKITPRMKGYKSAEDRKHFVKHEHGVIVIPTASIEKVLNDHDRSDSILEQLKLKETTQMMRNIERLTQSIVQDPTKRIRKRKLIEKSKHRTSKTNRGTPECCLLAKNSHQGSDSPLSRSITKRYSSLFYENVETTTDSRSVSPFKEKSEELVHQMLDYYKSYNYSPKPRTQLPLIKRPV